MWRKLFLVLTELNPPACHLHGGLGSTWGRALLALGISPFPLPGPSVLWGLGWHVMRTEAMSEA